jgi:cysteine desulfurase
MEQKIYFDNSASTRVDPRVVSEMQPYLSDCFGNPSSLHRFGREAREALEKARTQLSTIIHAEPTEIIFTSSGTESNNFALKGVAFANRNNGNHIIVSAIEHDCILNSCAWLSRQGFTVTCLPVDTDGLIDPDELKHAISRDTILVSVMHANNEIGTIEPIEEIGNICRERGVYFHTDACQSFGKVKIDVQQQNIDLLTINAHKMYGPKGVGALFIRKGVAIETWQHGGGHEFGLRSATENIPGIIGLARAAQLCDEEQEAETARLTQLREKIIARVQQDIPQAYVNGHRTCRLCNNVNFGFHGYEGEGIRLLLLLDDLGIAVSTGSACSSNDAENKPSHVLRAIGLNPVEARGGLRLSLGRYNTEQEADYFLNVLPGVFRNLRPISSLSLGGL